MMEEWKKGSEIESYMGSTLKRTDLLQILWYRNMYLVYFDFSNTGTVSHFCLPAAVYLIYLGRPHVDTRTWLRAIQQKGKLPSPQGTLVHNLLGAEGNGWPSTVQTNSPAKNPSIRPIILHADQGTLLWRRITIELAEYGNSTAGNDFFQNKNCCML